MLHGWFTLLSYLTGAAAFVTTIIAALNYILWIAHGRLLGSESVVHSWEEPVLESLLAISFGVLTIICQNAA